MTHPVVHEPEQFNYLRYLRCALDKLIQDPAGILEAVLGECSSRLLQTANSFTASPIPECAPQQYISVGQSTGRFWQGVTSHRSRTGPASAANPTRHRLGGLSPQAVGSLGLGTTRPGRPLGGPLSALRAVLLFLALETSGTTSCHSAPTRRARRIGAPAPAIRSLARPGPTVTTLPPRVVSSSAGVAPGPRPPLASTGPASASCTARASATATVPRTATGLTTGTITGLGHGRGGYRDAPTGPAWRMPWITPKRARAGPKGAPLVAFEIRRRPTLPGTLVPSTIGAGGLNCRVQNGNGCDPAAIATETSCAPTGDAAGTRFSCQE